MSTRYRKLIATSVLAAAIVFTSTGSALAAPSLSSQQNTARFANSCGASYRVQKGDTLEKIAQKCGVTTGVVRAANNGRRKVTVGKVLRFKQAAVATPEPKRNPPPVKATPVTPVKTWDDAIPTPNVLSNE